MVFVFFTQRFSALNEVLQCVRVLTFSILQQTRLFNMGTPLADVTYNAMLMCNAFHIDLSKLSPCNLEIKYTEALQSFGEHWTLCAQLNEPTK